MSNGKAAVLATPPAVSRPSDAVTSQLVFFWEGQDIRTLKRDKLLHIIEQLGGEVKQLREENTRLNLGKFRR